MTVRPRKEQDLSKRKKAKELGFAGYVLSPMWATLKNLLRGIKDKPRTVLYPYEDTDTPEFWGKGHYWRGMHVIDWSRCIGCGLCSRVCPTQCITMEPIPEEEADEFFLRSNQDVKKKKVDRPAVDLGRCSFCGNCEEVCPVYAWKMTNEFELANRDREAIRCDARSLKAKKEKGKPKKVRNRIKEKPVYLFDKCKGCQACIRNCSVQCVELVDMGRNEKNKPVRRILFHYDDCIGCGACVSVCKFKCLYMEREDRAKNDERVLDFLEKKKAGLIEERPKAPPKPAPKEDKGPEEKTKDKELIE